MIIICYFVVVDKEKLICFGSDSELFLPHIKIEGEFVSSQEVREHISKTTKFSIERNGFLLIYCDKQSNTYIYSCAIDANVKINKDIIRDNFKEPKCVPFGTLYNQKWDYGSKMVLRALENSNKYKEVIAFLKGCDSFHYYSESTHKFIEEHFVELNNVWQSEKPDIFIETKNDLIGIEVFSFDASKDIGYGSTGVVAEKEVLKRFDDYSKDFQTYSYHIDNSQENYINNFKSAFDAHIQKINGYICNLRAENKNNKNLFFGFLINDITQLGTSYLDKNTGFSGFLPYQIKEFWDFLFKEKTLDFIVFSQNINNSNVSVLITRDDYGDLVAKEKIIPIDKVNLLFMNDPIVMGQNLFISLDDLKKNN